MKLGYVWWVFHRLISINLSNGVLDGSGVTSSTAGLFVGYTVVEFKESLLLSTVSRMVRATWAGLEVSLLDERVLWPAN